MAAARGWNLAAAARCGLGLLLLTLGCSSDSTSGADEVNILLNNGGTGRRIDVVVAFGTYNSGAISIGSGAFVSDEYAGASVGMSITISASAPAGDGLPAISGSAVCKPSANIIGTSEYGQVDFGMLNSTTINVGCNKTIGTWQ